MSDAIGETAGHSESVTVVQFLPDWTERVSGEIRAGSRIRIEYDSARLPSYRHWHTGVRVWWIRLNVVFHPKLDLHNDALAVVAPETAETPNPLMAGELQVLPGTRQLEMWFENGDPMSPGTAWDSRYGSNYVFDVAQ
jgi:hypothetical protein